ncbi:MAG: site-specific DNA-methyltransferase [Pyrinomonadaceae bacterium]|nr:site-specific DNA-methyltransferase [Pyrinomonadaceae bacterium]
MTRRKAPQTADASVRDYRHDAKRKNNPPAGLAAQGKLRDVSKANYTYNPHLPPILRFDETGSADVLPELLQTARQRELTAEEVNTLAEALRRYEPWLEWASKREAKGFTVDPVALHIHERVSARAIIELAKRQDVRRGLFDDEVRGMYADPQQPYHEAVRFYEHDVEWSNRMILGDSLQVMASLARREDLAGKVQMIYFDPPYGIKFASNFQPEIGKRDVTDKDRDLTREPEMVKAYRDTWTLGIHSYLAYLRDRLILAKELLTDTGSIFVQISDENLHRVRCVMDEVFGAENFIVTILLKKKGGQKGESLEAVNDYLIWHTKNKVKALKTIKKLYEANPISSDLIDTFRWIQFENGSVATFAELAAAGNDYSEDIESFQKEFHNARIFKCENTTAGGTRKNQSVKLTFEGREFDPGIAKGNCWKHTAIAPAGQFSGMDRIAQAGRLYVGGNQIAFRRYTSDFGYKELTNWWDALGGAAKPLYVVQTNTKIIERCLLMTTNPGDLVIDPTCGSGTTAFVAEQWGRRWITIDSSRVALAIARQRLLTASFPFYQVKSINAQSSNGAYNPAQGFVYKTVPRITTSSIANNVALDAIFAKHQPVLDEKLKKLNAALQTVSPELRSKLSTKLKVKEKQFGKRAVTDADERRWILPKEEWKEWEVPFDVDEDWTPKLKAALQDYRTVWQAKMAEVNASLAANAEQVDLVDQPEIVRSVPRVSGAFTIEAIMPAEESLDTDSSISDEQEKLPTFGEEGEYQSPAIDEPTNAEAYHDKMLRLLYVSGVRFLNNKIIKFSRLEPLPGGEFIHAEGEWITDDGKSRRVAVSFGAQYGAVTAYQVENAIRMASRRGYDELVFAGFSFDATAQAVIQDDPNPSVRCHTAAISPDVNMGDLLKEAHNSQIFTVFGNPRTALRKTRDGLYEIEMQGVDIYNPVDNTILPTSADKVAAWFLDTDYDGRTFCITQAFFPDKSAWDKIARALKGTISEDFFTSLSGKVSHPFAAGKHKRAAVKVIDPRGNEVMSVHRLTNGGGSR